MEPYESDNESIDSDEEKFLKLEKFKLQDYINNPKTKKLLENDHLEKFSNTAEKDICNLYFKIKKYCKGRQSSVLHFDNSSKGIGEIVGLTYKYINKTYSLELFNKNPELAQPLIREYEDKKNKGIHI
jgi:hypothetical protein|tara:strand:+ start:95 stop:478 length:384 start_codon:yes stop_codon:yes gene_type:complete